MLDSSIFLYKLPYLLELRISETCREPYLFKDFDNTCVFDCWNCSFSVSPGKPPKAQLCSPKVSGNDNSYIVESLWFDNLKNRFSRTARRLSIIIVFEGKGIPFFYNISWNIMICIFVQLFYFIYEIFCFVFVFYVLRMPDKYRIFEFFLRFSRASQGFVVIQNLVLNSSCLITFTLKALKFYSCATGKHHEIFA